MVATQELSYTKTSNAMPPEWAPLNDVYGKVVSPYMTRTALSSDNVLSTQQLLPIQKMLSACTGAIATSIFSEYANEYSSRLLCRCNYLTYILPYCIQLLRLT